MRDCRNVATYGPAMKSSSRHEINNVLAAMMAEVQILQMDQLAPEQAEGLDRILSQIRRLRDLLRAVECPAPDATTE